MENLFKIKWEIKNNYIPQANEDIITEPGEYQLLLKNSKLLSLYREYFSASQCFLTVRNTGNGWIHQTAFSYDSGAIATRTRNGFNDGSPQNYGKWSNWKLFKFA